MINDDYKGVIYWEGFQDGQQAIRDGFKKEIAKIRELTNYCEDILQDPEKLVNIAIDNPEINSAITIAVVSLLLAEVELENSRQ